MFGRASRFAVAVWTMNFAAAAFAGNTVDDVAKKITEAADKLKSFSASTKTVMEMNQPGFSMKTVMEGTMEMLRQGETWLTRSEGTGVMESDMGGTKNKQESSTLSINDGTYAYTLSDMGGVKSATKVKMQLSNIDPFAVYRRDANLKLLPDESIDGHAVWVIEVAPKDANAMQGKSVLYYHKENGQMIKMVVLSADGEPMSTTTMTGLKTNPSLDADRFVFHAPPGVTVQDITSP